MDTLFPPACPFCQKTLPVQGCCESCLHQIRPVSESRCLRCGIELAPSLAPGPCGKCLHKPPFQQQTHTLFHYHGVVRDALLRWKLSGDDIALRWLVEVSSARVQSLFDPNDLLIPVPMPLTRMRKSGVHHSAELAKMIAEMAGCQWEWRLLRRQGEQPRQSALKKSERRKNLRKAFYMNDDCLLSDEVSAGLSSGLKGQTSVYDQKRGRAWVVDDIVTTGATIHHASKALRGLSIPVYAFSLTRTPNKE